MSQVLSAVYENGVFKPLIPPSLENGQHVQLVIDLSSSPSPVELLEMAGEVYEGLSAQDIRQIQEISGPLQ